MADLYITEFSSTGNGDGTTYCVPTTDQSISNPTTSAQATNAFQEGTNLIRLKASGAIHFLIGSNPTATTSNTYLGDGDVMDIGGKLSGLKIAAINAA